ncbi:MAG: hypothetical protein II114_03775 [Treponema sp.]|nr:hypothetical protein [Treponema sp.]
MKKVLLVFFLVPLLFIGCSKKGEEVSGKNGQTFLKVSVSEDNVELRYNPKEESSSSDRKLNKGDEIFVAGLDQKEAVLDGKKGFWVRVFTDDVSLDCPYWVFSSKIDAGKNLSPNTISFVSESIKDNGKITVAMKGRSNKAAKHDVSVKPVGDFYWFSWEGCDEGFNYADPVGIFIFHPSDKSIVRFFPVGQMDAYEGIKASPSPDLKYVFGLYGSSGMCVYDAATEEKIFDGSYYMDIEYSDGKIVWTEHKGPPFMDGRPCWCSLVSLRFRFLLPRQS